MTSENQDTGSQNQQSDLADTFKLFKSYLDNKLESLKEEFLCSGNDLDNLTKTFKKEVSVKFKNEGNKIQYNFNAELLGDLNKLQRRVSDSSSLGIISALVTKLIKKQADHDCGQVANGVVHSP